MRWLFAVAMIFLASSHVLRAAESTPGEKLALRARTRTEIEKGAGRFQVGFETLNWEASKTAVVVCDMWDQHWCPDATRRVGEMAPRMNEVLKAARAKGAFIIHCPSDCMEFYKDAPQRKLAQAAKPVKTEVPLERWVKLIEGREAKLPIDDSDGGCDTTPQPASRRAWSRQHAALEIHAHDAITDSAEAFYLMRERGIKNVIVMGVHTNMCVLGRPFSTRQMVLQGQNVVLMRDMTDSMYNPRKAPYVSHVRGTDLVVEHIEKYWCPSITSTDFTGQPAFRFSDDQRPHVVFLHDENHYAPQQSLPGFAQELHERFDYYTTFVEHSRERGFANIAALESADLVVLHARRQAIRTEQKAAIQKYLAAGKPLVALRTASHAFGVKGDLAEGFTGWNEFDAEVLGGNYTGHYGDGTEVSVVTEQAAHPILAGIKETQWTSPGSLYKASPVASGCTVLLQGKFKEQPLEPVAWTRTAGTSRVFYTSLGHPQDFAQPQFRQLLVNAMHWALDRPVPPVQPAASN